MNSMFRQKFLSWFRDFHAQEAQTKAWRFERKFLIPDLEFAQLEAMVKNHPRMFREIYWPRWINNIYFDTEELEAFYQNIDGVAHRTKVRIRWYGDLFGRIEKPVLELKIKRGFLGSKKAFPLQPFQLSPQSKGSAIKDSLLRSDIPENIKEALRPLEPRLLNRYLRKYFLSADKIFRITLDRDLSFYPLRNLDNSFLQMRKEKRHLILELKYDCEHEQVASQVASFFPFRIYRISKYVAGVSLVLD